MALAQVISTQNTRFSYNREENISCLTEMTKTLMNEIKYTIFSSQLYSAESRNQQYADSRNFLQNMEFHADYPIVSDKAKCFANELCKVIYDSKRINPSRTANSIEGGVAVVYSRRNGFLRKKYQEVFIECYNDNTAAITFMKNYNLQKVNEVSLENTKIVLDYITELFKS